MIRVGLATVAWIAVMLWFTGDLPWFSESVTHLATAARFDSVFECFNPDRIPLRPLQNLGFFLLDRTGVEPAAARLTVLAIHGVAALLLFGFARSVFASTQAGWLAWGMFACVPHAKTVAWVAALSWPMLVCALIAACWIGARHGQRPSAITGLGLLGCLLCGVLAHQGGVLVVPMATLCVAFSDRLLPKGAREATPVLQRLRRTAVDPYVLALGVTGLCYLVYVTFLRTITVDSGGDLSAMPASFARALLAFTPADLRLVALDGLRTGGPSGLAVGGLVALLTCGVAGWLCRGSGKGGPVFMALVLLPLLLPCLTAGFRLRYAYGAAPFVALLLTAWFRARPGRFRACVLLAIGIAWASEAVRDVADYRVAGGLVRDAITAAREARERAGPDAVVVLLDPPLEVGRDADLFLFNYGLRDTLLAEGVAPPLLAAVQQKGWRSTDLELVSTAQLQSLVAEGAVILRWDPAAMGFLPWRP